MTNLITLTIPNDDHIALRAFSNALEEMALARGAPLQVKFTPEMAEAFKNDDTGSRLIYPVENYVHMYHADTDVYRLARSDNEVAELLAEGYVQHTQAQYDAWEPKRNRDVETGTIGDVQLQDELVTAHVKITSPQGAALITDSDSTGTPWDERIHSTSKALNSDGSWRLRRKPKDMDEADWATTIQSVQDELRFPQEPVPVTPSDEELCFDTEQQPMNLNHVSIDDTPEPPVTPPGDDFHTDAGVVTEQAVAGIPPIPVPPPVVVPPVPAADEAWTFPKLMVFLTNHNGKISIETVNQILSKQGMQSLKDLNGNENSIPAFVRAVQSYLETESASN